jgi:hypothetical protein
MRRGRRGRNPDEALQGRVLPYGRAAIAFLVYIVLAATPPAAAGGAGLLPGEVVSSWIANSFGGARGAWVQQDVCAMTLGPDDKVYAASRWDEGGRETGVYRDGEVLGTLGQNHGWARKGGCAVAVNARNGFVAMEQGHHRRLAESPPAGTTWYAIRRYSTATMRPLRFTGGDGYDGSMRIVSTQGEVTGLAASRTEVYAAVKAENLIRVYALPDMSEVRSFSVPSPTSIAMADDGAIWVVAGEKVQHYSSTGELIGEFPVDAPTSISIHGDKLVVPTDGPRQQVLVFNTRGVELNAIGVNGGMFAPPVGAAGPLRFDGIVGAAFDPRGNLYVAASMGGWGTDLRKLARRTWAEEWQLLQLAHVASADVDPNDDTIAYTSRDRFRLDRTRPPGQQWRWDAHLVDRKANPDDPRLGKASLRRADTPQAVNLSGKTFLFTTNQGARPPQFYRVEGSTSFLSTELPAAGFGWHVDENGDVWSGDDLSIARYPYVGLSPEGDPQFGTPIAEAAPGPFTSVQRIEYDAATDVMYLAGWTVDHPRPPTAETLKLIGSEVLRYDNWSTDDRSLRWRLVVPFLQAGPRFTDQFTQISMSVAGDYLFTAEMAEGTIRAYRTIDAALVQEWNAGPEVGGKVGALDLPDALNAHRRADGSYDIFVQDVSGLKVMHYQWVPPSG